MPEPYAASSGRQLIFTLGEIMTSVIISNSLIRIDGPSGEPPLPFERPNNNMSFWVLELPRNHLMVSDWCNHVVRTINKHAEMLHKLRLRGCKITLFIETTTKASILKLDDIFLKMLGEYGISLEHYTPE